MAVAAVEREELFGENFLAEHIVKENGRPAAVYIGAIAASDRWSQAEALGHLREHMARYRRKGLPVYARPVTKRGLQLLNKNGFVSVSSGTTSDELKRTYKLEQGEGD